MAPPPSAVLAALDNLPSVGSISLLLGLTAIAAVVAYVKLPKPVPDRWELRLFLLVGMSAKDYIRLTWHNGVDLVFWHRYLYGLYISLYNSLVLIPNEKRKFPDEVIDKVPIKQDPIFVLGHFRSGTSLLHELLNMDSRLVAPNALQCFTPQIFLAREDYFYSRFSYFKIRRPMDRMKVGLESAFEDEFAISNVSYSPYLAAVFPRQAAYYERFLTFRDATAEEIQAWKASVIHFFKKILFHHQDQRLILKSPSHTARVHLLREMFPKSKFIHISRNPYEIYLSTMKLHEKLLIQWCLQRPPLEDHSWRRDTILNHFKAMYESYYQDIKQVPQEDIIDIRYTDLVASPTKTIQKIYEQLGLEGFDDVRPKLEEYEKAQGAFKVNKHPDISPEERQLIREAWGEYFDRYGYQK